jgi:hypothetical protein
LSIDVLALDFHFLTGGSLMARLWQKLWDFRNRGVDTPRSPSWLTAGLRGLTPPAQGRGARRSCRPQLEPLEDRLTPSGLDFFPVAHVAVNQQPLASEQSLPPSALVEFDPLLSGGSMVQTDWTYTKHIVGVLSKQITMPPGTAGTPGQTWSLEVFYNLTDNEAGNFIPPSPFAAGSVNATYSLTGTMAEILIPQGPTTLPTWTYTKSMAEYGTLNGALSPADPSTAIVQLTGQSAFLEFTFGLVFTSKTSWSQQDQNNSQGNLMEILPPGGGSQLASFWQQDQVTECLMQITPFHPPSPCITIDAVFTTWGSVTEKVLNPPGPTTFPAVDIGTTQYTDQLAETIMMPDGSMQTLTQNSQDNGTFIIAILIG